MKVDSLSDHSGDLLVLELLGCILVGLVACPEDMLLEHINPE